MTSISEVASTALGRLHLPKDITSEQESGDELRCLHQPADLVKKQVKSAGLGWAESKSSKEPRIIILTF